MLTLWHLWHLIHALIRFSRETKLFLSESECLIANDESCNPDSLRRTCRGILTLAVLYPVVCGVIAPMSVIAIACSQREYGGPAVLMAIFLGFCFSLIAAIFYLFAGVAFGCLLAPNDFMKSPVGKQWLTLIGTKNITAARVVCLVMVLATLLIMTGICFVEIFMLQAPALNR